MVAVRPDPYQFLGIDAAASPKEIRAAYRRRARSLHPDVGGGGEQFRILTDCANLLLNASKRDHFDWTGQWPEEGGMDQPDPRTVALAALTQLALGLIEQRGEDPGFDLVTAADAEIRAKMQACKQAIGQQQRLSNKLRKAAKRITRKDGGVPFLRGALLHQAGLHEQRADAMRRELGTMEEMRAILSEHEWEVEHLMILSHFGTGSSTSTTTFR